MCLHLELDKCFVRLDRMELAVLQCAFRRPPWNRLCDYSTPKPLIGISQEKFLRVSSTFMIDAIGDFSRVELRDDPYPLYSRLRQHSPVHFFENEFSNGFWTFSQYVDIVSALKR